MGAPTHPQRYDDDRASDAITALNGEIAALRAEINSRLSAQQVTIGAYLTATGVATGLVVNRPGHTLLLLVIPLLAAILGSAYLAHSWTINHLGAYIRDVATPFLRGRTEDALPSWEETLALVSVLDIGDAELCAFTHPRGAATTR
jgi:hypothetical protein